jgi:hypothetical protein
MSQKKILPGMEGSINLVYNILVLVVSIIAAALFFKFGLE